MTWNLHYETKLNITIILIIIISNVDVKINIRTSREAWQGQKIAVKKIPVSVFLSRSAPKVNGVYSGLRPIFHPCFVESAIV